MIYAPNTCGTIESFTRSLRFNAFKQEYEGVIDRIAAFVHGHADWLDPSHSKTAKEEVAAGFAALKEHLFGLRADHLDSSKAQLYGTAKKQFHELDGLLGNKLISHRQRMDAIVSLAGKARVGAGELMQGLEEAIAALKPPLIYSAQEHGEVADFILSPKFDTFQEEYENVIDRITAFLHAHANQTDPSTSNPDLNASESDPALSEKTEAEVMASFKKLKEHLFDSQGRFFGPHLPQVYGAAKRLFHEFDDMLGNSRIPPEQRLTAIRNLAEPAEVCSGGLMTELEEAVARLKRFNRGLKSAAHQWKINMMNELILQHIKTNHLYPPIAEVHYVNVYYNHLAEEMGVAPRQDEYVQSYKPLVSAQQLESCRQHVLSKLRPSLLAATLADEYRPRLEKLLRKNKILFKESESDRSAGGEIASQDSPETLISYQTVLTLQDLQKSELDPEYGEVLPHAFLAAVDKNDDGSPHVYTGAQRPIKFARYFLKELKYAKWADYKSAKLVLSDTDEGRITMLDNLLWFKGKDGETREVTAQRWLKIPPETLLANIENTEPGDAQARASLLRFIVEHVHDAMKAEKNEALRGEALDKWLSGFVEAMERRKSMEPSWVTPIMWLAVAFTKISAARDLVDAGCDINARDTGGRTMLMLAAMHGDTGMVNALIEKGANSKAKDKDGRNALMLATLGDHAEVVNVLARKRGNQGWYGDLRARWKLNATTDKYGENALTLAARNNKLAAMKALLRAGANKNATNENGQTALLLACRDGKLEAAELLIESGASKNIADKFGQTAMIHAAHSGEVGTLKLLIAKGADKKAVDGLKQNALTWAAIGGEVGTVEVLLDAGFDKNGKDRFNQTPLMHAASNGRTGVVQFLLDQGADPNAKNDHGRTALLLAARSGSVETARCFIDRGDNGVHALMEVKQFMVGNDDAGVVSAARTLLHAGADGVKALEELALQHSRSKLQYLVKAGADKHMDAQGKTALIRAVEMIAAPGEGSKGLRALKALLDAGADPEVRDQAGKTARMHAQELAVRSGNDGILRAFDQAVAASARSRRQQFR